MKKIPLRYYLYILIGLVMLALAVYLGFRIYTNRSFVQAYYAGEYDTEDEEKLLNFNFPESFVPYYNLGDAAYKLGDYNAAIGYYSQALEMYPTGDKDCQIRINLALSYCNTIDFYNLDSQEKIDTALFILYKARDVLLENGCASDEGDGHNAEAQQLKEDIDRMIEMLKNPDSGGGSDQPQDDPMQGDDDNSSQGNDRGSSDKERKIQGELEEKKKNALEDRKEQQDNLGRSSDYIGEEEGGGGDGDENGGGSGGNADPDPW